MPAKTRPPGTSRRDLLRLAALAPVAAGCASAGGAARASPTGRAPADAAPRPAPGGAPGPAEAEAIAAVRAAPLPGDAAPALLFRALRAGEGAP